MALNFPNTPNTGDSYTSGGSTWVWDGVKWESAGTTGVAVTVGATPPTAPQNGTLWFDTVSGQLFCYYNDGNSSQWVVANSGALAGATGPTGPAGPTGATGPAASAVAAGGNPNIILNGNCEIDQRNEGGTVSASNGIAQSIDGFSLQYGAASSGVGNAAQVSGGTYAATNFGFQKALSLWCATAQSSVGAGDFALLRCPIEANDIADWPIGVTNSGILTLSLLAHALGPYTQVPYTFNVVLTTGASANPVRCYPLEFTITAQNVWQPFTAQIPMDQAGGWVTSGTGIGAMLWFTMTCGSSNQGVVNTWNNQQVLGTSRNTNSLMTNANARISITGIKLEKGNIATPFMRDPFQVQLARAQRRYEKSYDFGIRPGTANSGGAWLGGTFGLETGNSYGWVSPIPFKTSKRAKPTMQTYDMAGAAGYASYYTTVWNNGWANQGFSYVYLNGALWQTPGQAAYYSFEWTADAAL